MPVEYRRLVFGNAELVEALLAQGARMHIEALSAPVIDCEVIEGSEISVRLTLQRPNGGGSYTSTLDPSFIGAALVQYCMDHKIPLPRRASKSLQIVNHRVALNIVGGRDPGAASVAKKQQADASVAPKRETG